MENHYKQALRSAIRSGDINTLYQTVLDVSGEEKIVKTVAVGALLIIAYLAISRLKAGGAVLGPVRGGLTPKAQPTAVPTVEIKEKTMQLLEKLITEARSQTTSS